MSPTVRQDAYGTTPDGRAVHAWTLEATGGLRATVLTLGASLAALTAPAPHASPGPVVLGLPSLRVRAGEHPYLGPVVGRYANRIAHGRFTLDGTDHRVPVNDRGHALHGGPDGFHRRVWRAAPTDDGAGVELSLHSPHGDMGFPGALDLTATYRLAAPGTLAIDYRAVTDRPTVVNPTNHAYFNLAGQGTVHDHLLELSADHYLPVTAEGIPYGPPEPVAGTPFDFGRPVRLGGRIADGHPQVRAADGLDHCWVLRGAGAGELRHAATLAEPSAGRRMEVWTTEPGVQVYTGNNLDGTLPGADGRPLPQHAGICLETQHLPDSPNRPEYPSTVLRPGREFRSRTEFRFSTQS
ncbi:aldose epimerase family protein [Streptomyces sp. NRRL B-24484]|uniref:aldose epimerase family protein n=1 Tax=Streptomyces sp. NRRL B-24484 TaxID=1463833 RepID=UPI0004BF7748|nr:aldose epimerase family protein [Streptomyces sp. NRRL B-24484]